MSEIHLLEGAGLQRVYYILKFIAIRCEGKTLRCPAARPTLSHFPTCRGLFCTGLFTSKLISTGINMFSDVIGFTKMQNPRYVIFCVVNFVITSELLIYVRQNFSIPQKDMRRPGDISSPGKGLRCPDAFWLTFIPSFRVTLMTGFVLAGDKNQTQQEVIRD